MTAPRQPRDPYLEAMDREEARIEDEAQRLRALGGCRYCRIHPNHPECTCEPPAPDNDEDPE